MNDRELDVAVMQCPCGHTFRAYKWPTGWSLEDDGPHRAYTQEDVVFDAMCPKCGDQLCDDGKLLEVSDV